MPIKCKLSAVLGEKRLKMTEVAKQAGLSYSTVWGLYHDKVQRVDYPVLEKLCRFLCVQPGDLLVYEE